MEASAAVDGGSYTTVSVASVAAPCTGGGSVFAGTEESNVRWASTCVDDKPPLGTGRALQTAAAVELAEAATTVVVGRGMEPVRGGGGSGGEGGAANGMCSLADPLEIVPHSYRAGGSSARGGGEGVDANRTPWLAL